MLLLRRLFSVLIVGLTALLLGPVPAHAQSSRLLPVGHWSYDYIAALQTRGYLLELNPTALPYAEGPVAEALRRIPLSDLSPVELRWVRLLQRLIRIAEPGPGEVVIGGDIGAGLDATNNDRLDPLRYTDAGDPTFVLGDMRLFPWADGHLFIEKKGLIARIALRHDVYYDVDPDGLDAVNRLYIRSQDSYVGYNSRFADLYVGRFRQHWGTAGSEGVIVSDNPVPYDVLTLRLGGERFALRSFVGELDAATPGGEFTGTVGSLPADERARSIRRFISAHRFDWRPSKKLTLSILESTLYSSPGAGFSLKFLNPLQAFVFEVDNTPKNDENNGMLAGLLWAQHRRLTLTGQLLIDDYDLMGSSGEPGSFALFGALAYAPRGAIWDASASLTAASARVYNTHQPEGRYLYLNRGLGMQYNDFLLLTLHANVYLDRLVRGLTATPKLQALWQGEERISNPYPKTGEVDFILNGTVERTIRPSLELRYQPSPWWWARLNVGVNALEDANHQPGVTDVRSVASFSIGARLQSAGVFSLDPR